MSSDCCPAPSKPTPCCCSPQKTTTATLSAADIWGDILCRFSNRARSGYRVEPGLYALGAPSPESPVLVTCNYKLTFDIVRRDIKGHDVWILVLDTQGVNVWCAAGKRTFGTAELVRRIHSVKLADKVSHKRLILPQLGAPGIAAHEIKKQTGFSVMYGPVRSKDLRQFLSDTNSIDQKMRTVTFTFTERLVLIPIEVVSIFKKSILPIGIVALVMGLQLQGIMFGQMIHLLTPLLIGLGVGVFAGTIMHPIAMPFLIARSFALQGAILGAFASGLIYFSEILSEVELFGKLTVYLLIITLSSYQAFNFTGSTPIANKSGVKREFKIAIPLYIGAAIVTAVLAILYKISAEGLL